MHTFLMSYGFIMTKCHTSKHSRFISVLLNLRCNFVTQIRNKLPSYSSCNSVLGWGFEYKIFTFFLLYPIDCSHSGTSYRIGGVCDRRHMAYISVYIFI